MVERQRGGGIREWLSVWNDNNPALTGACMEKTMTDEKQQDAQASEVERIVMCSTEDAFAFFGASLVDHFEHYFPMGEQQIAELSHKFQKEFEARLDKNGKYT